MTLVNGDYLLSNSEVQTYQRCPREWWLSWHRGLRPRQESFTGVRNVGTRVHVALAALYQPTPADPLCALHDVQTEDQARLNLLFEQHRGDNDELDTIVKELRTLESSFELEAIMIEGYLGWLESSGADEHLEVLASESYVETPLLIDPDVTTSVYGLTVKLIGKIDARVRSRLTGRRMFIDHKTGDFPKRQSLKINQQMKHYHVIEWLSEVGLGEQHCDGALYNTLRRVKRTRASKPPYYQRDVVDHNAFEIGSYHLQLQGVAGRILRTRADLEEHGASVITVPPQPSRFCEWGCAFAKICPMFDDGSRVEAAVDDMYEVTDPLSYYGGQEKGAEVE